MTSTTDKSDSAFIREVRIGLAAITFCLLSLCYVAYVRMSGGNFNWLIGRETTYANAPPISANDIATKAEVVHQSGKKANPEVQHSGADQATYDFQSIPVVETNQKELKSDSGKEKPSDDRLADYSSGGSKIHHQSDASEIQQTKFDFRIGTDIQTLRDSFSGTKSLVSSEPGGRLDRLEGFQPLGDQKNVNELNSNFEVKPASHVDIAENNFVAKTHAATVHKGEVNSEQSETREIVTVANDNFWSIAMREYDDGRLFRALYLENQDKTQKDGELLPGTIIRLPPKQKLIDQWPDACKFTAKRTQATLPKNSVGAASTTKLTSKRIYVSQAGDTLFDIAREQLNQAYRYRDLIKLNESRLPANVTPSTILNAGIKLELPGLQ